MNSSLDEFGYFKESPIECYNLKIIAGYLLLLFLLGVAFNSILIVVFIRNKSLITPINLFVVALVVLNLIGCLTEIPVVMISNFNCR